MKSFKILFTFAFVLCFGMSYGQLTVNAENNVAVNGATNGPTVFNNKPATLAVLAEGNGQFPVRMISTNNTRLFEVQQGGIGSGNFFIYDNQDNRTIQFAGGPQPFYINTGGNVGIGTTTPSVLFEVNGTAAKPGGGDWSATSDMRSKRNVKTFNDGLKTLMNVAPVVYQYNGKFGTPSDDTEYVGVIAQDLQKAAPYMVRPEVYSSATLEQMESPNYASKKSQYEEEFLTVDPSAFTYILINAVKEQQAIIDALEDRIEALEKK